MSFSGLQLKKYTMKVLIEQRDFNLKAGGDRTVILLFEHRPFHENILFMYFQ